MKNTLELLVYIISFIGFYLLLSLVGLIITERTYLQCIRNFDWFGIYSVLLGWWLAAIPCFDIKPTSTSFKLKN